MLRQSLWLDLRVLRITALRPRERVLFVVVKYLALIAVFRGRRGSMDVRGQRFYVGDLSAIGTLQSAICDMYDDIVAPGIITDSPPDRHRRRGQRRPVQLRDPALLPRCRRAHLRTRPAIFAQLTTNLGGRAGVVLHNVGLGREQASLPFFRHELSLMSSFSPYADHDYGGAEPALLEVRRLDSIDGLRQRSRCSRSTSRALSLRCSRAVQRSSPGAVTCSSRSGCSACRPVGPTSTS